jgi:hypothetical protein
MKKSGAAEIISTAIMIVIVFCIIAARFDSQQQQIDQLKSTKPQQIVRVEPVQVDAALVERLEELTRLNERLEMENAGMHDYIEGMGKTWDKWASENSFPKEAEKE